MRSVAERFWEKVDMRSSGECWEWKAFKDKNGYGRLSSRKGKSPFKAHRLSYELRFGNIKEGLSVLHKCDNPSCVNPNHLFLGTQKDNIKDASQKGRMSRPLPLLRGEGNGSRKLNDLIVHKIRSEYEVFKKSFAAIARENSVSPKSISNIIYRRSWRHI